MVSFAVLFKLQISKVMWENGESQKKKYEADSERDAHIGRHMNLFASGFYEPPLALSLPVAIERIKLETSTELEVLKKGQSQCRFKSPGAKRYFF